MADESLIRAVLAAHREDYDSDCDTHGGCRCGWFPDGPTGYGGSARFAEVAEAWLDHVMERMRAAVMAEPKAPICVADGEGDQRRCTVHRQWWPAGPPLCPEGTREHG